jgi:uncharacterized damage-inducible protein DinB
MVSASDYRRIFAYNRRVLDVFCRKLERLPWQVVSKEREAGWHSMAGTLNHILRVYDAWLNYVIQGEMADWSMMRRAWSSLESMAEIRKSMERIWAKIDPYLKRLTDRELRRMVRADWQPKACAVSDALMQVTLEQAHHTGEIIAMLWQEDLRPPEMTWLGTNWALEDSAPKPRPSEGRQAHHRNA